MKRSRVLNRPMFNKHNSAYGRGIASNLVTEEQRVRYNAGGRVGLWKGAEWLMKLPGAKKALKWGASKIPKKLQPQLAAAETGQLGQMGQAGLGYRQAITDAEAQAETLKAYEPYQRTGFMGEQLTGLMGGYPGGSRMQITPTASPLQQGLMTGLGGAAAYKGLSGIFK